MERPTLAILAVMLMLGLARCEDYSRFLVDIVEPTGVADVEETMATVNSILQDTAGVDFIFKVVGEPRVLAILNITSLCDMRSLEKKLLAAKLDITVKSLFLGEKLAADLGVNKTLIESALPPSKLTGGHIYFWDAVFRMEDLTSEEYKDEIRDNLESGLNYRLANHQDLVYRVLGQFPIQMLYFASLKPEEAELVVWHFNRRKLIFTTTVALVQNLDDYLNDCQ
ncbi:uncharacterized protein LOC124283613 [Haliotis rubra]|uniref:uncharacterized protein LOC124283613 n=1 Tax=Haliotis rubra TaxID=36100 RepID=UPI001EE5ADC6|nr:uncharacterized protein LOC124283613 [Haliotis rubra]